MFSSRSFMVSDLIVTSLIHFELIFCERCKVMIQFLFFFFCLSCPTPVTEETLLYPLYIFSSFVINLMTIDACFWALYSDQLDSMSFLIILPYCFAYQSFVIQFEIREHYASTFFFLKLPLAIGVFYGSVQIL